MKEYVAILCYSLVMLFAFAWVMLFILTIQGCSGKEVIKYEQVLVPTPQVCDLNISYEPQINTENLQDMLKSLKDLSYDSKELRKTIREVPCLKINYRDEI